MHCSKNAIANKEILNKTKGLDKKKNIFLEIMKNKQLIFSDDYILMQKTMFENYLLQDT